MAKSPEGKGYVPEAAMQNKEPEQETAVEKFPPKLVGIATAAISRLKRKVEQSKGMPEPMSLKELFEFFNTNNVDEIRTCLRICAQNNVLWTRTPDGKMKVEVTDQDRKSSEGMQKYTAEVVKDIYTKLWQTISNRIFTGKDIDPALGVPGTIISYLLRYNLAKDVSKTRIKQYELIPPSENE